MVNKKVCIIGSGIGGLTTGALLSKQGYTVDIFEKESFIGGRALTLNMTSLTYESYKNLLSRYNIYIPFSEPPLATIFDKKMFEGYNLDLGFHVIGGVVINKINNILFLSNKEIDFLESRLYEQKNGKYGYFVTNFEKLKMLPSILRLLISGEKKMKELDEASITDTIKKYARGKTKIVLEVNSRLITTVNNLDLISTGEVFRTQKDMRLKGVRYPKKGLANISKKLADFIKQNGGEIYFNTSVEKIIIKNKRAEGIIADGKKYFFDIVVSSILIQNLFKIADEKHFPKNYVRELKSLEGSGSLCAYYSLKNIKSDLIGKTFVFMERDVGIDGNDIVGLIDFMASSKETGMAPSSKYLVQSYVICTPNEARDKKTLKKLKNILDKNLEKIVPDYHSKLNWVFYPAIWHLDGVAKTINNKKPEIVTPIKNLFLVGDCVKAPGIGINCAINSSILLKNILLKNQNLE